MSWEGRDPWRDEDGPLDPDRRDAALERLLLRVTTGERYRNGRNYEPLPPADDAGLTPKQVAKRLRRLG